MLKRFLLLLCLGFSSNSLANATEYKIAGNGNPVIAAITSFQLALEQQNTGIQLRNLPDKVRPRELMGVLDDEIVDIAVVRFEDVEALARSPLLRPFLAENAGKLRQTINSEVGAYEKADVEQDGYRVLDFWHVSSTVFGTKAQVASATDLQGLKIRDGGRQIDETLFALGAVPIQMAAAEVFTALQTGVIDSAAVPYDNRARTNDLANIGLNYVDRLYKPRIYAVLIKEDRWRDIPFPHQHHLARVADEIGESLAGPLDAQATSFKSETSAVGSAFYSWDTEDTEVLRTASLETVDADASVERQLVNLAFDTAAATAGPPETNNEQRSESALTVLFATDRILVDLNTPDTAFSSDRKLRGHTFGEADVTLKDGRRPGDNLKKAVTIDALSNTTEEAFMARLTSVPPRDVVIFVHGYNNAFTDSIKRGATIQEDIAGNAVVISYTWPSDGELLSYG